MEVKSSRSLDDRDQNEILLSKTHFLPEKTQVKQHSAGLWWVFQTPNMGAVLHCCEHEGTFG